MMSHGAQISTFVMILTCILHLSHACFITNCPPGGKRSLGEEKRSTRQCTACGPSGTGRCFGPSICCGPEIGCFLNTRESAVCSFENLSPVPCNNYASSCTGSGKCAAAGLCCTTEECRTDESCYQEKITFDHRMSNANQRMLRNDVNDRTAGQRFTSS